MLPGCYVFFSGIRPPALLLGSTGRDVQGRYTEEVMDLVRSLVAHRASGLAPSFRQSMRVILAILSVATLA